MRNPHHLLAATLRAREMEQSELAAVTGHSVTYISLRMNRHEPWTLDDALLICERLDIPLERMSEFFHMSKKAKRRTTA